MRDLQVSVSQLGNYWQAILKEDSTDAYLVDKFSILLFMERLVRCSWIALIIMVCKSL